MSQEKVGKLGRGTNRNHIFDRDTFKAICFSSLILLAFMLLPPLSVQATTETITFTYYDSRELKKTVYGTGKTVEYVYDSSGNRLSQTISSVMPRIAVAPITLSFASPVGSTSAVQNVTVTNTGTGPLDIERTGIKGSNATEFTIQSDTCAGKSIPPAVSCTVSIVFAPLSPVGLKAATLEIISNAPNRPNYAVTLSGDAQCGYVISPEFSAMPYSGGSGSVSVTTDPACTWSAVSNNSWLSIVTGSAGAGNGTVGYEVQTNAGTQTRTATALIAENTFTVSQGSGSCTYTISPASKLFGIEGGTGSTTVTTTGSCAWTTTNDLPWITVTSGQNGSGSGTAQYTVQPNTEAAPRRGVINVAGKSYTITQGGTADAWGIGIFRKGLWMLDANDNGVWDNIPIDKSSTFTAFATGDIPVTGDWNGDGITEIGLFRSSGNWLYDMNGNGTWDTTTVDRRILFTAYTAGDIPVTGDWNGDGITDIGLFRSGHWLLDMNGNGIWDGPETDKEIVFADYAAGDLPETGDWNGNGKTKIGIFRTGTWMLDFNGDGLWDGGTADRQYSFTAYKDGDLPVTGDWNGIGRTRIGILRGGEWLLDYNGNGVWNGVTVDRKYIFTSVQTGDLPVTGKW